MKIVAMQPSYVLDIDTGDYVYCVRLVSNRTHKEVGSRYFPTLWQALNYCEWANKTR